MLDVETTILRSMMCEVIIPPSFLDKICYNGDDRSASALSHGLHEYKVKGVEQGIRECAVLLLASGVGYIRTHIVYPDSS